MAVQMQTRPLIPLNLPKPPSGIVEDEVRPAVWLVVVTKSKDLSAAAVAKAAEEFNRLSTDYQTPSVVIRLEFVITQVPTSRKSCHNHADGGNSCRANLFVAGRQQHLCSHKVYLATCMTVRHWTN